MLKTKMIRAFFLIVGYPTGHPGWLFNLYCVIMVTLITGSYTYARFIHKYFVGAATTTNLYDKFPVIVVVSSPAVLAVAATNWYHLYRLIKRRRLFSKIFRNGGVFGVFGGFDVAIMLLSTLTFVPNLVRKTSSAMELIRLVVFGPFVNLNFFIGFQFCAILKYHKKNIDKLAELTKKANSAKTSPRKLAMHCVERHKAIVTEVLRALEEFDLQMFVVIFHLVIDMIQFPAYTFARLTITETPLQLKLTYLYMGSMRWIVVTYINAHFHMIKKQDDDFRHQMYKLMKAKSELCYDVNEGLNQLSSDHSYLDCSQRQVTLYVAMKQRLVLTACGFFTYGYPLLISIVGAVTTNLVVLVQFSVNT